MFSRSRCSSYSVRARSMDGSISSSSSSPESCAGVRVHSSIRAIRLVIVSAASACAGLVADLLEHRREERDRLVQETDRLRIQRDASHPQAVEDVLQVMGQLAHRVEAEHARQTLEGVSGAEESIDQLRVDIRAGGSLIRELAQILSHLLEDLLGLGDELAVRLGARRWISSASPPSATRPAGRSAADRGRSAGDHRDRRA